MTLSGLLEKSLPPMLVGETVDAYLEAKRNYRLGGYRLSAVEAGRFCEACIRVLEQRAWGTHTPLGKTADLDATARKLASLPASVQPDSVRLHIPRALRVIYDVRNKRDIAHLADGIDPNLQDATLVVGVLDWIMVEFVRLYGESDPVRAQSLVSSILRYEIPVIEDFNGFPKVLDPALKASDFILVLLYGRGQEGATLADLNTWSRPQMRSNLRRTLRALVDEKAFVHFDGTRYRITQSGIREVEGRDLFQNRVGS